MLAAPADEVSPTSYNRVGEADEALTGGKQLSGISITVGLIGEIVFEGVSTKLGAPPPHPLHHISYVLQDSRLRLPPPDPPHPPSSGQTRWCPGHRHVIGDGGPSTPGDPDV
ncbi:hypothetical protein Tco_1319632 [Tanacetum coccineum]